MDDVPALRKPALYTALRRATANTAQKQGEFRLVHISIQNTHLHIVVEAEDKGALARGRQSLQISAARVHASRISVRKGIEDSFRRSTKRVRGPGPVDTHENGELRDPSAAAAR